MVEIAVGSYVLTYEPHPELRYETYNEPPDFYGVKFYEGTTVYDVIWNRHMGERFIIMSSGYTIRDMPFNERTALFLPDGVRAAQRS